MATEIERKFLVIGSDWRTPEPIRYCQGYLNRDKYRTVRVRIAGDNAFLTIKGLSTGASRAEFEYAIPMEDARQLLEMCEKPLIEKKRHLVQHGGRQWEVDEFLGDNQGLVIAEIELQTEQQAFELPTWVGAEVTEDQRYYNSNLSLHPFTRWEKDQT